MHFDFMLYTHIYDKKRKKNYKMKHEINCNLKRQQINLLQNNNSKKAKKKEKKEEYVKSKHQYIRTNCSKQCEEKESKHFAFFIRFVAILLKFNRVRIQAKVAFLVSGQQQTQMYRNSNERKNSLPFQRRAKEKKSRVLCASKGTMTTKRDEKERKIF